MLVSRIQPQTAFAKPIVKKSASKAAEKLGKISFDVRPNKFMVDPFKDLFTRRCDGDGGGEYSGLSICDPPVGFAC